MESVYSPENDVRLMSAGFVLRGEVSNLTAACEAIDEIVRNYHLRMVYKKASEGKLWVSKVDPRHIEVPTLASELRNKVAEIEEETEELPPTVEESETPGEYADQVVEVPIVGEIIFAKKRGRPKGSKNKPRVVD